MKLSEQDQIIIKRYKQDEEMMIIIFAQWCINNDLDAHQLYEEAYPQQGKNKALVNALENTVSKEQSQHISRNVVLAVLQIFGNDDLAFVVQQVKLSSEK